MLPGGDAPDIGRSDQLRRIPEADIVGAHAKGRQWAANSQLTQAEPEGLQA